eukprot:3003064-Prymnesium_polylepis.1
MPPLDVTSAEYIVLLELPDMMSLLLAEISVVYAHDIQGRHYDRSAHSCSGMVSMPEAEACDDGDVCGICLVEFDSDDGEAVAAAMLGVSGLLPNGHCPVHGRRGQRANVTRPVRRGHVGDVGGDEDANDEDDIIGAGHAATET